jgi:hypothetical protein
VFLFNLTSIFNDGQVIRALQVAVNELKEAAPSSGSIHIKSEIEGRKYAGFR